MPWQECSKVDERLRFVARLLEGEKMAVLCREFDISRKTGHKIFNRIPKLRIRRTDGSQPPTVPASQPLALSDRNIDCAAEEGAPHLGRSEDPREDQPSAQRDQLASHRAPCMRSLTGTDWSAEAANHATKRKARPYLGPRGRTIFGARTTRASSCSPINATVIRSRSPTSRAAT